MNEEARRSIAPWEWICLAGAVAVGAAIRGWLLLRVPGLWYDEAINGLDALSVLRDGPAMFYDTFGHVREPLYMWLEALGVLTGGTSSEAIRGVSTVIGVLTIPAVWALGREWRGPLVGAVAAWVFALLRWHITFSALAFRTILAPLVAALVLLFLLRLVRTRGWKDAAAAGAFLGLGAYTYLAFRLMPFVLVPPLALLLWQAKRAGQLPAMLRLQGALLAGAALVFLPLAVHFVRVPEHFTGRSDEVTLAEHGKPATIIARQARDVALMMIARGDHVGKHNIPNPPGFWQGNEADPAVTVEAWQLARSAARATRTPPPDPHGTGVPALPFSFGQVFYGALLLLVRDAWRGDVGAVALLSFFLIGSLASVLSYGAPNMLRLLYLTPAVALVLARAADGWRAALQWARSRAAEHQPAEVQQASAEIGSRIPNPGSRSLPAQRILTPLIIILGLLAVREIQRLRVWIDHPMVAVEFNGEWRAVGDALRAQPDQLPVLLPFDPPPTLTYLADGYLFNPPRETRRGRGWELRTVPPFPPLEPAGTLVPEGRQYTIMHPQGLKFADLVEVEW